MDPSTGLVSAHETLPDTFFELSSAEAAQIVASNRRKLENGNVLLTKKHREQEAQKRRDKVQHLATIRIMFQQKPISDVCVEAVFDAHTETIADVYTFVREILSKENKNEVNFELFVAPRKRVLKRTVKRRTIPYRRWLSSRRESILFVSLRCAFSRRRRHRTQRQVFGNASIARRVFVVFETRATPSVGQDRTKKNANGTFSTGDDDDDVWGENNRPGRR